MGDLDGTTISVDELCAGHRGELLAEVDVVIAVDANSADEEVVYGRHEWDLASASGREDDLAVLRVELDMDAGDLEWLTETLEAVESGDIEEGDDDRSADENE